MKFSVTVKSKAGVRIELTADKVMEFSFTVKWPAGARPGLTKQLMLIYFDL